MARQTHEWDLSATLSAAEHWINTCLVEDLSLFSKDSLWTASVVDEVYYAFVEHPDFSQNDFRTKLKGQMSSASASAQRLMAEMLWALLLFPANIKARTKRQQIREIWDLSEEQLPEDTPLMRDEVLVGIGSGGPAFNNYRPDEMTFLIELTSNLKRRTSKERQQILADYEVFADWIDGVPRQGIRQFRHMLRYFAFPDRVERISSNNDRRSILEAFEVAPRKETKKWTDRQLDDALLALRCDLQNRYQTKILDFYEPKLKETWAPSRKIKTEEGEVTVIVPRDDDDIDDDKELLTRESEEPEARQSLQVQAKLADIGTAMGFKIWIPRNDRNRVRELVSEVGDDGFLEVLPLNYDLTTLDTIEQIDVLWLKGRSIVRAFEVEHTTAVYSGLLRMADLLALQPNMNIRLHIVASDERREKVFREMLRPVFSLLDRGPLARSCTFISYESVDAIRALEHLAHTTDTIISEYEESSEADS